MFDCDDEIEQLEERCRKLGFLLDQALREAREFKDQVEALEYERELLVAEVESLMRLVGHCGSTVCD